MSALILEITRYFRSEQNRCIWKFPSDGQPQIRSTRDSEWMDSTFVSLPEFTGSLATKDDTEEIDETEGEP